jgi:peptidyl-prolyl cis-trans isomerase C
MLNRRSGATQLSGCRLLAIAALFGASGLSAQALLPPSLPDNVVARRGGVDLTVTDIDVKVRTIPPEMRAGYMAESDRAIRMIDSLLLSNQLAARAIKEGLDQRPDFKAELELLKTELLSRYLIERHIDGAPLPNVEALSKERYLADPKSFTPSPRIDVSHILVSVEGRDEAAARQLADEALARAKAGEDFLALAEEYGEGKGGVPTVKNVDFSRMDPKFSLAVGELDSPGDITGPVRTQFGYHVIRLDMYQDYPTPPFDKVKDQLVAELSSKAKDKIKNDFLSSFSKLDPQLNDAVIEALRVRYVPGGPGDVRLPLKIEPAASP